MYENNTMNRVLRLMTICFLTVMMTLAVAVNARCDDYDNLNNYFSEMMKSADSAKENTREWAKDIMRSQAAAKAFKDSSDKLDSVIDAAMADKKITREELKTIQDAQGLFNRAFEIVKKSLPGAYRSMDAVQAAITGADANLSACTKIYRKEATEESKLMGSFAKMVKKRNRK